MDKYKPLYTWSKDAAKRSGQSDLWDESYNENCRCAREIEKAIATYYKDNKLITKEEAISIVGEKKMESHASAVYNVKFENIIKIGK